jgi:hypothetical protein
MWKLQISYSEQTHSCSVIMSFVHVVVTISNCFRYRGVCWDEISECDLSLKQ